MLSSTESRMKGVIYLDITCVRDVELKNRGDRLVNWALVTGDQSQVYYDLPLPSARINI